MAIVGVAAMSAVPGSAAAVTGTTSVAAGTIAYDGTECEGKASVALRATTTPTPAAYDDYRNEFPLVYTTDCTRQVYGGNSFDAQEPCTEREDGTLECHEVYEFDGEDDGIPATDDEASRTEPTITLGPDGTFSAVIDDSEHDELVTLDGTLERQDV